MLCSSSGVLVSSRAVLVSQMAHSAPLPFENLAVSDDTILCSWSTFVVSSTLKGDYEHIIPASGSGPSSASLPCSSAAIPSRTASYDYEAHGIAAGAQAMHGLAHSENRGLNLS